MLQTGKYSPDDVVSELMERREAARSLHSFVRQAWPWVEGGREFVDGRHLHVLCEHLEAVYRGEIKRLLINVPPRTSKSTVISVMLPAWWWINKPEEQFLYVSYALNLSMDHSVKCRRVIESDWYRARWGNVYQLAGDQSTKIRFDNTKLGYRIATSTDGTLTGTGGSCLDGETLVLTPAGQQRIKDIKEGACVYSYNHLLDKVEPRRVLATRRIIKRGLYEVSATQGVSFKCTGDHKVFTEGGGYIPAESLLPGQRVVYARWPENDGESDVRFMRKQISAPLIRYKENYKQWCDRFLLWQEMRRSSPLGKKFQRLYDLWKAAGRKAQALLFGGVPKIYLQQQNESCFSELRTLFAKVCFEVEAWSVLFFKLQKPCALSQNGWKPELKSKKQNGASNFFSWGIPQQKTNYFRKGWGGLRELQNFRKAPYTSHKSQRIRQFFDKFDNFMLWLSQKTPHEDIIGVSSVTRISDAEHEVYDIQIEGNQNFFANGVLVHNCLLFDDPNSAADTSDTMLKSAVNWFTQVFSTRLNDPKEGKIIGVQQRICENDISGHILAHEKEDWVHLCLPMQYEPDRKCVTVPLPSTNGKPWEDWRKKEGELLWPEHMDDAAVKRLKKALQSEYAVAGQLQQRPAPLEGGIIKRAWFKLWPNGKPFPEFDYIIQSYDTAFTEKAANDPSACTTWGIFKEEGKWCVLLLDCWEERLEYPDLRRKAIEEASAMYGDPPSGVDMVLIEDKASGIILKTDMAQAGLPVRVYNPGRADKVQRTHMISHLIEGGMVYLPESGKEERRGRPMTWCDPFLEQVSMFPNARHDDMHDTMVQALIMLKDMRFLEGASIPREEEDEMEPWDKEQNINPYAV